MFKKTVAKTGFWNEWGSPLAFGTLAGALCVTTLLLLAAALCVAVDVPAGCIAPMAFVAAAIGAAAGGFTAGKCAKRKGWLFGLITGIAVYLVLLAVGALCVKAVTVASIPVTLLLCVGCGCVGGIIGVNTRRRNYSV